VLHIVSADLQMGKSPMDQRGFYAADTLNLTINIDDLYRVSPQLFDKRGEFRARLQEANRYRCVWKGQVFRPYHTQPDGYHTVKKNKKGDVIVDHEGKSAAKWDKINLTKNGGSKTVKQGVKAVKDWHKKNPHKKGK